MDTLQTLLCICVLGSTALGQFIPSPAERVSFVLQKYRLDECIGIANNFYISLNARGTSVFRWVAKKNANDVTVQVGCPACGQNGGNVMLQVYRGYTPLIKTGNPLDGLAVKLTNVRAEEALYIQIKNANNTKLEGLNLYVISDIRHLARGLTATRNIQSPTIRYDFSLSFKLSENQRIPTGGAVIVRFDGDRRLGDNYIRYGEPVQYDNPDGIVYTDKFDIWAQDYKTFGDELLLCPPKYKKSYFVSGRSYWDNDIVNYKVYYGIIYPIEKLQ